MIGAIAGDIIGSIYEEYGIKTKEFPLFDSSCRFTDDTVLTVAAAKAVLTGGDYGRAFLEYYWRYPNAGFGGGFHIWARSLELKPYGSFGNGSAMRVSPVGWAFEDLETVLAEARRTAEVTHNHPEGIKGAQATAAAVFLARKRVRKDDIRTYIQREFEYDLRPSLDLIRPAYEFDVTCQGTVPAALISFLESNDFEDAIRNAVSLGGDSDTLACITGSVAGAFYDVPSEVQQETLSRLDDFLRGVVEDFSTRYCPGASS
ncbi:MAG: ADP-ribosylglycohydrolase family protein [Bryobacteraceae bacterium]